MNLSGRLVERGTRAPLVGVLVTVFRDTPAGPEGFEATTDATGHFQFYDLAPGDWRVSIESPGYYPYRTTEKIAPGEGTVVRYFVERGSYNPFDVTVTAERQRKEVNRVVLPATVIDKIPGTAGDPLNVLATLPGVARTPLASGEVVVRGAAPQDTQFLIDGTPVPNIFHFGGLRSVLPVGMLESIDFQPGNFSSFYGRATGGIIDVQVKKLKPDRVRGSADLSLLDAGLYLEAPITDKGAIAVAARRSYFDLFLIGSKPDDTGVNLVAAPAYYDYQILGNYRVAAAHDLRLFFFGSDDRLAILFGKPGELAIQSTSNRFDQHQGFYRGLFEYRYVPSERLSNNLNLAVGHDTTDVSLGNVLLKLNSVTLHVRDTLRWKMTNWLTAVAGLDFLAEEWTGHARLPAIPKEGEPTGNGDMTHLMETRLDGVRDWSPGWFGEVELAPLRGLTLSLGLRGDTYSRISETTLAPRLIARYRLVPSVTLKGGAGLYYQPPQLDETDPNFGNPALKAERALHLSVGAEWKPRPFITIDGTLFYKTLSNLVSPTDATVTDAGGVTRPLRFDNNGVGRVWGFELLLKRDFTEKFVGWIAYTLSRSERRDSGQASFRPFDFDQTHILAAVASYQLPSNWQIGARFRLVSGTPVTPVVGSVYNSITDQYDPTYGAPNSGRDPTFQQLDIRVDRKWIHDVWTLTWYLDLQNVYNHANSEGPRSYNFDYTKSGVTQGLPVLAIVGFKAEF